MDFKVEEAQELVLNPKITLSHDEHAKLGKAMREYFTAYNQLHRTKRYNEHFSQVSHIEIEGVSFKVEVV